MMSVQTKGAGPQQQEIKSKYVYIVYVFLAKLFEIMLTFVVHIPNQLALPNYFDWSCYFEFFFLIKSHSFFVQQNP